MGEKAMPAELTSVRNDALSLPEKQRAELAKELLSSLDGQTEQGVDQAWDIEICRRINEIEAGNAKLVDAADVLNNVKQRLNLG